MSELLPDANTRRLFHAVSGEARAALVTSLAKQETKQISVLLVADPRRALEIAAEAETYSQWLTPKLA